MLVNEYIKDRYEPLEALEKIAEHLTIDDVIDIITEYELLYVFESELEEDEDQYNIF